MPFDSPESLAVKRQKLVDHTKSEVHRTPNHVTQNPSPGPQTQGLPVMDLLFTPPHRPVSEGREPELKVSSHHPPEGNAESPHQQQHVATNHHKKKKPKKHKDKERTKEDSEWLKKSPDLRQKSDKLNRKNKHPKSVENYCQSSLINILFFCAITIKKFLTNHFKTHSDQTYKNIGLKFEVMEIELNLTVVVCTF